MRYPGFVGPSARARSPIACDDRTVNLYIEANDSGTSRAPYTLYRTPGYRTWCNLGTSSPVRGLYTLNGASFAVAGGTLYQLPFTIGGSATTLATGLANPDDGNVTMVGNGDAGFQLAITAGSTLYNYDLKANVLTTIAGVAPSQVVFLDGTAYALDPTTSTIFASAPEDFSTWNLLDVYQRSNAADKMLALARVGTELWTLGSQTTTVLFDAGSDTFPLTPNPSIFIQNGTLSPWSVRVVEGVPIWLGAGVTGNGTVYRGNGYTPTPISTNAVEYALGTYGDLTAAEAFEYQAEGHLFYVLNIPGKATWAYDLTEQQWHERGEFNGVDYNYLPVRNHIFVNNAHLVGSRTTGIVYEQTLDVSTETDGVTNIRWLRRAPHLVQELRRNTYSRLQLDAQVGVGTPNGAGSAPRVAMHYSNDGGQSFGSIRYATLGAMGQYSARAIWYQLGNGRNRVFELYGADPVPTALVDAYLDIRPGVS